jgi:PAS domain S-box-containing protein
MEDDATKTREEILAELSDLRRHLAEITEQDVVREKVSEYLKQNESRYLTVVESIPEHIALKDTEHVYISCNSLFASIFGKSPAEVAGMRTEDMHPPELAKMLNDADDAVIASGQPHTHTSTVTIDGTDRIYEATKHPVKDENGKVTGILSVIRDVTEQKRIEETLMFSDAALKSIQECVYAMDNDFNVTYWNATCEEIFGIEASKALGRYIGDLITMQEDYPGQNDERVRLLVEKGNNREEQVYITPNGAIWVDVLAQTIDRNGKRHGWITLANDITERKKVEEELRISEERTSRAFRSVPDGITITRLSDGRFIEVNDSFLNLTGYTREEVLGHTTRELNMWVDDHDRETLMSLFKKDGKVTNFEHRFRKKSGETGIGVINAEPITMTGMACAISVVTDITEKKKAEEQLRYQASLVDNVAEAIISHDFNLKILSWNKAAERIFEIKKEDIIGKDIRKVCRIEPVSTTVGNVKKAVNEKGLWRGETIHHLKSGKSIHMRVSTMVVRGETREQDSFVLIMSDITEEKKAEAKLKQLYEQEITLRQKVEHEMKKRTEFSAAIVHELKTPLTAILSSSELMMEMALDETLQRLSKNINRSAYELTKRTNELFDMSRGELGILEILPEKFNFLETIRSMQIEFEALFSRANISFTMAIPETLPPVYGDEVRIRQVIYNLIDNASKYTPEGGTVTLIVKDNTSEVLVEIRDTGPGLSSKQKESIFEPYRQLIDGTRSKGGMGLGLAIARNLVEAHGGTMRVESRKGKGSRFFFTIPYQTAVKEKQ